MSPSNDPGRRELSRFGQAALSLAAQGWRVFPLAPRSKVPLPGSRGFKDATDDEDQIRECWTRNPDANIGVRTGSIDSGGSGIWSLDFDTDDTKDGLSVRAQLKERLGRVGGVILETARGVQHIFVHDGRSPNRCCTTRLGVDVRSNDGYCIAPPSIHPSGKEYRWGSPSTLELAPKELLTWLDKIVQRKDETADGARWLNDQPPGAGVRQWSIEAEAEVRSMLAFLDGEAREDWLRVGFALYELGWGEKGLEIWNEWSKRWPDKYRHENQRPQWKSFGRGYPNDRITIATLAQEAMEKGWKRPQRMVPPSIEDKPPAPSRSWRPFPLDSLPEEVRGIVAEGATALGCDRAMIAAPFLVTAAAAIGNSRVLQIKSTWFAKSILWLAVVADSGTVKSPALGYVIDPLRAVEQKLMTKYYKELQEYRDAVSAAKDAKRAKDKKEEDGVDEDVAINEGVEIDAGTGSSEQSLAGFFPLPPRPTNPRLVISDVTVEAAGAIHAECPRGLLVYRDELIGLLKSPGAYKGGRGGDESFWLEAYNASRFNIDRKMGPPLSIRRLSISVLGTIQPLVLADAISDTQRASGLTARLLTVMPPRTRRYWTDDEVPSSLLERLRQVYEDLLGLAPEIDGKPVALEFSPEAKKLWVQFFNAHAKKQYDADGDEASFLAKLEEVCARFALVLELISAAARGEAASVVRVSAESMRRAIALEEWFENEAYRLNEFLDGSREQRERGRLLEYVQRHSPPGVTTRDVTHAVRSYRGKAKKAQQALDALVASGDIEAVPQPSGRRGGRPTIRYVAVSGTAPGDSQWEGEEVSGVSVSGTPGNHSAEEPRDGCDSGVRSDAVNPESGDTS